MGQGILMNASAYLSLCPCKGHSHVLFSVLPLLPSKCCFICLLGSYFCSFNALFDSPVWGNACRAVIFLFTSGDSDFLEHCKNSLNLPILTFQKTVNFGLFLLFLIENGKSKTQKMVSTKRNLNFVKRRNGGFNQNDRKGCKMDGSPRWIRSLSF